MYYEDDPRIDTRPALKKDGKDEAVMGWICLGLDMDAWFLPCRWFKCKSLYTARVGLDSLFSVEN